MELVFIKFAISTFVVVALAEVSKRINPKLAGVLMGLPLGAGLSVYFIAAEKGIPYVTDGIPWAIAGLTSALMFNIGYLLVARLVCNVFLSVIYASFSALLLYFANSFLLVNSNLSLGFSAFIFVAGYLLNGYLLNLLNINFESSELRGSTLILMLKRAGIVGFIILVITSLASVLGSRWAGALSSFPSALYALVIVLHVENGNHLYPSVIGGFASGVCALAVFFLLCLWLLPLLGLALGFGLSLFFSSLFLAGFGFLRFKYKCYFRSCFFS